MTIERPLIELELLSRMPAESLASRPPLLFVHGAFHAAWCWDEHFLPFFAAHGWEAHAVSLRGHGGSEGRDGIRRWRLRDYVADVDRAIGRIGRAPVLIGHSMGGTIAQKVAAQRSDVPSLVLVAASPRRSSSAVRNRLLRSHPWQLVWGMLTRDMRVARPAFESFFHSPALDAESRARYSALLDDESYPALHDLLEGGDPADPHAVRVPSLVISGEDDWSIPREEHAEYARILGGPHCVCPGAHDLMLDPAWERTATTIEQWLRERFDAAAERAS